MKTVPATYPRWVRGNLLESMAGYTQDSRNKKRSNGVWLKDIHWVKAPDGKIMYDWRKIDEWAASGTKQASGQN